MGATSASLILGLSLVAVQGGAVSCTSEVIYPGGGGASASDAGSGGRGGASVNGPGTPTVVGPSPVTTYGTGPVGTTTMEGTCDRLIGGSLDSPACDACIECTRTTDCQVAWNACGSGQPCGDFMVCLVDCGTMCGTDTACYETCIGTDVADPNDVCSSTNGCIAASAQGCVDYLRALNCSVCQFCPVDCDAASNCS